MKSISNLTRILIKALAKKVPLKLKNFLNLEYILTKLNL